MSKSLKKFKEKLRNNWDCCFCGERLKIDRNGIQYCPKCIQKLNKIIDKQAYRMEVVRNG